MHQITEGVYTFTGLMAGRVYALESTDGLTLIDASIPPAPSKILKQMTAAGRVPSDIKRILITHAHPDHVGGLPALKQATGAQVFASELERPIIQDGAPIPRSESAKSGPIGLIMTKAARPMHVAVEQLVDDGTELPDVLGGLVALATPGHAPGHIAYWQPERRIAFVGDTLFNLRGKLSLPFAILTCDPIENKRAIARLIALEPEIVLFGHGPAITRNATAQLRNFARSAGIL